MKFSAQARVITCETALRRGKSMTERDYYDILQLHPEADHAIVIQAYWHLARKYKVAIGEDAGAERKLEELNAAFAVLGSPDKREAYDLSRAERLAAPSRAAKEETVAKKRVTIEVSYWNLPAWQGILAATGTLALATLALLAGAHLVVTLVLAAVAMAAALVPTPRERDPSRSKGKGDWSARGERELKALELERSTSAVLARWRRGAHSHGRVPSLTQMLSGADTYPRRPASYEPPQEPSEHE